MGARWVVVLDTNILVAAAYHAGSLARKIVQSCLNGSLDLILSDAVREEMEHIVQRAVRSSGMRRQLQELIARARRVEVGHVPRVLQKDPSDDHLLALAIAGNADFLITQDRVVLERRVYGRTRIVTAREFWEFFRRHPYPTTVVMRYDV